MHDMAFSFAKQRVTNQKLFDGHDFGPLEGLSVARWSNCYTTNWKPNDRFDI